MTLTDWEQPIRALSHATFRRRHLRIAIGTLPRKWEGVRFSAGADADTLDDVEKGTNLNLHTPLAANTWTRREAEMPISGSRI